MADPKASTAAAVPIAPPVNVTPAPTVPAGTSVPVAKRPLTMDFTFSVKNHAAQDALAKRFKPEIDTPPKTTEPPRSSWFEEMSIHRHIETDNGLDFTIDVQPDFRNPLAYVMRNVTELYPSLDIKASPFITPMSLVYYDMSLIVGSMLIYDSYVRRMRSVYATSYYSTSTKAELLETIGNLHVPSYMARLLSVFCPVNDAQKTGLMFIPTFAGFSLPHDFGRLVPPRMFLIAHHLLASSRVNTPIHEIMHQFYAANLFQVGNRIYTVAHATGGPFLMNEQPHDHSNWIRDRIEALFNPVVARTLAQRPTLARIHTIAPLWQNANDVNPYDLMFGYTPNNSTKLMSLLSAVSTFVMKCEPGSPTLGALLQASTGIVITSHYITMPTLPTCHNLPGLQAAVENIPLISDREYAQYVNFLVDPAPGHDEIDVPDQLPIEARFILIRRHAHQPNQNPFDFVHFDEHLHTAGPIITFQPYDRQISSLAYTLSLGLTIENGDLDGVTINMPNALSSLAANHSQYLQGALPLAQIRDYVPTHADVDHLNILDRVIHYDDNNAIGFARRDMSRNLLPIFDNQNIQNANRIYGFQPQEHINDGHYDYTYFAFRQQDNQMPIPARSIYLWSSYRGVLNATTVARRAPYMYATLKSLYGNAVNMSQMRHYTKVFPS